MNIRRFLVRLGKKKLLVGIRSHIDGVGIFILNSGFTGIKDGERFQGVGSLHELAKRFDLPVVVCSWQRDEYGTSDGAHWEKTGITISPKATLEELAEIAKSLNDSVSCYCTVLPNGQVEPIDKIQL